MKYAYLFYVIKNVARYFVVVAVVESSRKRIQIIEIISVRDIFNAYNVFESLELSHNKHLFFLHFWYQKWNAINPIRGSQCVTQFSNKTCINKEKLYALPSDHFVHY